VFLALEKLINDSLMELKWHFWDIIQIKLYDDSIMQHLYESKGLFKYFVKLNILRIFEEYFGISSPQAKHQGGGCGS
jgi:hypothetical protein